MANLQLIVCIVIPGGTGYSETFIQAHIDRLPAQIKVLTGDWFYNPNNNTVLPLPLLMLLRGIRALSHGDDTRSTIARHTVRLMETLALRHFLHKNAIDVVLAEYGMLGIHITDACVQAKIPLVVHFHGYDAYHEDAVLQHYRTDYRRMFLAASAIIAVSRDMEQQLLCLGAAPQTIFYNPYGIDGELFAGANPGNNPPLFVAVGRFVDKKAPLLTLLAFRNVVRACPEARLIMIGDGILWEASKDIAAALGLNESVEFPGPLAHQEVAAVMQRARAFVQHSVRTRYGDSEGTPVAVLEASMSGLPVVSTRHAGIKDVVIEGETGFLVDERDVNSMAEYMLLLAQDAELAGRMGQRAREHVAANFSMEQHIEKLWEIIESACQTRAT